MFGSEIKGFDCPLLLLFDSLKFYQVSEFAFSVPPIVKVIWRRATTWSHIQQTGGAEEQTQDPWVQGKWFKFYQSWQGHP